MSHNNKIKIPFCSVDLYNILSKIKNGIWLILPVIIFIPIVDIIQNDNALKDMAFPLLFILMIVSTMILFGVSIINVLFSEYLIITDKEIIHIGPKIDGNPEQRLKINNLKAILWENEKLAAYGSRNSLYFIDASSNYHQIFKNQFAFSLTKGWFEFLHQISTLTNLTIDRGFYVLSPDLKERYEVDKSSPVVVHHRKLSKLYKIYIISIGITAIFASFVSVYFRSIKHFIIVGILSVLCCLIFTSIFSFISLRIDKTDGERKLTTMVSVATLIIPFFIMYTILHIIFAFILGKPLPI